MSNDDEQIPAPRDLFPACSVFWCLEPYLPNQRLCFRHEMEYILKYGRPSAGDVRFSHGRGFLHAI